MRILVAGGSGAVGRSLIPRLIKAGHQVNALSRTEKGLSFLSGFGASAVRGDVLDAASMAEMVAAIHPDAVINQVTDLSNADFAANARARREGTRNLVEACEKAKVDAFITQSISWAYEPGSTPADEGVPLDLRAGGARRTTVQGVAAAEEMAARIPRHVILRYGMFYGTGTWHAANGLYAQQVKAGTFTASAGRRSFIHVDDAAAAAVAALDWPPEAVNVVDDDPASGAEWVAETLAALGEAGRIELTPAADWERAADNSLLHSLGFELRYPTWRGRLTSG